MIGFTRLYAPARVEGLMECTQCGEWLTPEHDVKEAHVREKHTEAYLVGVVLRVNRTWWRRECE